MTAPTSTPLALLLALALLAGTAYAVTGDPRGVHSERWTEEFDDYFRKYSKRYFGPHFDWRWFKSQGITESRLDPAAVSPAGAVGIMQILPSTYAEIRADNPHFRGITEPRWNIAAGIFYNRGLYRKWRRPLPGRDRLLLAFASYNAGYGRVLAAQRRVPEAEPAWLSIEPHLPAETRAYVARIRTLMGREAPAGRAPSAVRRLLGG